MTTFFYGTKSLLKMSFRPKKKLDGDLTEDKEKCLGPPLSSKFRGGPKACLILKELKVGFTQFQAEPQCKRSFHDRSYKPTKMGHICVERHSTRTICVICM